MSLEELLDIYEITDTLCPCSSYEEARRGWCELVDSALPWDEIEPEQRPQIYQTQALIEDLLTTFFMAASTRSWAETTVAEKIQRVEGLLAQPQIPQRTSAWYAQGKQVLTASEFSTILGTPRAIGTLAVQKAAPPPGPEDPSPTHRLACSTMDMTAMDWGVRFEPIVKQILTVRWGAEILEFGRLLHPTDPRLAASPDGILIAAADPARIGRLVEIKCPIRREITGAIPYEYWCQMQIQMEVCDIDECEYVEAKINSGYKGIPFCEAASAATKAASAATKAAEAATKAASAATNSANSLREQYAGTLWLLQEPTTLELKYAYMALERKDLERCGWNVIEEIPWNLDALSIQVVARDRAWFASTAEARDAFWTKVEDAKAGTFVLPPSSRPARVPKGAVVQVCKIED